MIKRLIFKNLYPIISSISSFTSAEKLPITNYAKHTNAKQSSSEGITFNFNALSMLIYIIMAIYRVYPMTSNSLHDGAVTQLTEKIADEPALSSQGSMMKLTETQTRPKKNENPIVSCTKPETKVTKGTWISIYFGRHRSYNNESKEMVWPDLLTLWGLELKGKLSLTECSQSPKKREHGRNHISQESTSSSPSFSSQIATLSPI